MDFPPVKHLISATFDQLNYREPPKSSEPPPIAPQPVAAGAEFESNENFGSNSFASNQQDSRVGRYLNTVA